MPAKKTTTKKTAASKVEQPAETVAMTDAEITQPAKDSKPVRLPYDGLTPPTIEILTDTHIGGEQRYRVQVNGIVVKRTIPGQFIDESLLPERVCTTRPEAQTVAQQQFVKWLKGARVSTVVSLFEPGE